MAAFRPPRRRCVTCQAQFRVPVAGPGEVRCLAHRGADVAVLGQLESPELVPGPLEVVTFAELTSVVRESTPLGVLLLKLAREVDGSAGVAAQRLAREYRDARLAALEGTAPVGDVIDVIFGERQA